MSLPNVSVIIVNYNNGSVIMACMASVMQQRGVTFEVIVVDNGSSDGSREKIVDAFPDAIVLYNHENRGYAGANNQGIARATGAHILLLNPDTELAEGLLAKLSRFIDCHPETGVVGPKMVYPDKSLQLSCRTFYSVRTILMRRTALGRIRKLSALLNEHVMADWDHSTIREVDWVLGACMMFPRNVIDKTGGLDEKFRLYFEDVDLCWRIKDAGWKVYYNPTVTIVHHHQRESAKGFSKKTWWHIQSAFRFFNKHGWRF